MYLLCGLSVQIPALSTSVEAAPALNIDTEVNQGKDTSDGELPGPALSPGHLDFPKVYSPLLMSSDSEPETNMMAELDLERAFEENLSREDLSESTKRHSFTSQTLLHAPGEEGVSGTALPSEDQASKVDSCLAVAGDVEPLSSIQPVWDDDFSEPPPASPPGRTSPLLGPSDAAVNYQLGEQEADEVSSTTLLSHGLIVHFDLFELYPLTGCNPMYSVHFNIHVDRLLTHH